MTWVKCDREGKKKANILPTKVGESENLVRILSEFVSGCLAAGQEEFLANHHSQICRAAGVMIYATGMKSRIKKSQQSSSMIGAALFLTQHLLVTVPVLE